MGRSILVMHCRGGASLLCVLWEENPCYRGGASLLCVIGEEHPCYVL